MNFVLRLGENVAPDLDIGDDDGVRTAVASIQVALQENLDSQHGDFCTTQVRDGRSFSAVDPVLKPYRIVGPHQQELATTLPPSFFGHYLLIEIKEALVTVLYALRAEKG